MAAPAARFSKKRQREVTTSPLPAPYPAPTPVGFSPTAVPGFSLMFDALTEAEGVTLREELKFTFDKDRPFDRRASRDMQFKDFPPSLLLVLVVLFFGPDARAPPEYMVPTACHLITYPKGTSMGAHRDSPYFWGNEIWGISLGSPADMVFRHVETGETVCVTLPPRSIYVIAGEARTHWTHSITRVASVPARWSITLRCPRTYERLAIEAALHEQQCSVAAGGAADAVGGAGFSPTTAAATAPVAALCEGGAGGPPSAASALCITVPRVDRSADDSLVCALQAQLAAHDSFGPVRHEFHLGEAWATSNNGMGVVFAPQELAEERVAAAKAMASVKAWRGAVSSGVAQAAASSVPAAGCSGRPQGQRWVAGAAASGADDALTPRWRVDAARKRDAALAGH